MNPAPKTPENRDPSHPEIEAGPRVPAWLWMMLALVLLELFLIAGR